jgi:hypothetical protein
MIVEHQTDKTDQKIKSQWRLKNFAGEKRFQKLLNRQDLDVIEPVGAFPAIHTDHAIDLYT